MSVSIIIPVYNGEKYIGECISSIKDELLPDDHIIIIDDGSEDRTREICESYNAENGNITIISQKNQGVSEARNVGIRCADDDYLMFVDSDDQLIHGWRAEIKKYEKTGADFVAFGTKQKQINDKKEWLDCIFGLNNYVNGLRGPWSKLYRTEFIKKNNISFKRNIINGEDMLFNIDVAIDARKFTFVNKDIYLYRKHSNSCTQRFNPAIFESDKKFHSYLEKRGNMITEEQKEKCIKDAISMFVNKISRQKLVDRKKYIGIFNEKPYKKYIYSNNKPLDSKMKYYRFVIRHNMYSLVSIFNYMRKIFRKKQDENKFTEI